MTPSAALTLARSLMAEHGLTGWTVSIDRAKVRGGCCHYSTRKITLGAAYLTKATASQVRNTILHEIAHALAGFHAGHGPEWRKVARSIGCDAQTCHNVKSLRDDAPWRTVCSKGHATKSRFHRAPLTVRFCKDCGGANNPGAALSWAHNGRVMPLSAMPVRYQREVILLRRYYGSRFSL